MNTQRKLFSSLLLLLSTLVADVTRAQTINDLSYPPTSSAGHDLNHSPVGQSFKALVTNVTAGIYIASDDAFTDWLSTIYPGQIVPGSYPYTIAPSVSLTISLYQGEGTSGQLLHSTTRTLTAPYMGFVDVDYASSGVALVPGQMYTILVTDNADAALYPSGVSGWVVPAVTDSTSGTGVPVYDSNGNVVGYLPYGAYPDGHPILQGTLIMDDAGTGDISFHVLDTGNAAGPCSGVKAVVTSVGRDFIAVNGGQLASDHVFYTPTPAGTTFLGGTSMFLTGELVSYNGTLDSIGACHATTMTVEPAPAPVPSPTPTPSPTPAPSSSCTKPAGAKSAEGTGKINSVGAGYVMLGTTKLSYASCTTINVKGGSLAVGQRIEWKGYRSGDVVIATSVKQS